MTSTHRTQRGVWGVMILAISLFILFLLSFCVYTVCEFKGVRGFYHSLPVLISAFLLARNMLNLASSREAELRIRVRKNILPIIEKKGILRICRLMELFLVMFVLYGVLFHKEGEKILIPTLCLFSVFLFERLQKRIRVLKRHKTRLDAHILEDGTSKWVKCTVVNISLKGVGLEFYTQDEIKAGSTILLSIIIPEEEEPLMKKGELKWIQQRGNDFIGGIELTKMLNETTFAKLREAHTYPRKYAKKNKRQQKILELPHKKHY